MQLNTLILHNFKCFEELGVEFLPRFNVIIGNNGTGKSSLMEGLCLAVGSFLSGIDEASPRNFQNNDARYIYHLGNPEYQFPMRFRADGLVDRQTISWAGSRNGRNAVPDFRDSIVIKEIAENLQKLVRKGEGELPIIAYFGANRLWGNPENEGENDEIVIIENESRLAAYKNALRPIANYSFVKKWFISKELAAMQAKVNGWEIPTAIHTVKKAIIACVENCEDVYYNLDTKALLMKMKDGKIFRWNNLSDGQRNMLAMVADIAYRCAILNPQLGTNALGSKGIVMIDELDVHLHPNWQKKVASTLKTTFPNIQFIVTTHSPLILHSLELGDRIISLEDNQAYYFDNGFGRDVNDTLLQLMDSSVENEPLAEYLEMIESGTGKTEKAIELRKRIEEKVGLDYKELAKADALLMFYNKS